MIQKSEILYLYYEERRNIRSNIPLFLKDFPRAKPEGTPVQIKSVTFLVAQKNSYNFP